MSLHKQLIPSPPKNALHETDAKSPRKRAISSGKDHKDLTKNKAITNHLARMIRRISLEPDMKESATNYSLSRNRTLPRVVTPKISSHNSSQSTISSSRYASVASVDTIPNNYPFSSPQENPISFTTNLPDAFNDKQLIHPELEELITKEDASDSNYLSSTNRDNYLVGLSNLGNTCYMNSILQCLLSIKSFVSCFNSSQANHPKSVAHGNRL
jgi:hypothetical protein